MAVKTTAKNKAKSGQCKKQSVNNKKRRRKKKSSLMPALIAGGAFLLLVLGASGAYFAGRAKYDGKFLPNTYINNVDVSGKTLSEAKRMFEKADSPTQLEIVKQDGKSVVIKLQDFDYEYDTNYQLEKIYNDIDYNYWFKGLAGNGNYSFAETLSYDKDKLKELLLKSDWGKAENKNAEIQLTDNGYVINEAVQGDKMDYSILESYIIESLDSGNFVISAVDSGCYEKPEITAADLKDKCDRLNKAFNLSITYDFDYTTETLTGKKVLDIVEVGKDGKITANPDKAMKYVEYLAEKYDTYNTERKFHATIQGDITVPISSDAKYGWWIDQQKTCDALVDMLETGKNVESVDPIYYQEGNYIFTGREKARTKNDDIGNTYIEIDLTNQKFWYYENGKKKKECDIVSGQTTSEARTTLPGVYKVWNKATDYRMKDSNSDGESWDTTCAYWTRVAIVGIGLHDSQWRYAFGGNIYKWNGSHGCINMPLEYAKFVHDKVPMETPVVMYY